MSAASTTKDVQLTEEQHTEVNIAPPPVQLVFDKVTIDVQLPREGPPCAGGERPIKRILDEVTGIFGPSELIACMGPSGSGKTTMLNALTGVTKPTSGSITANGEPFEAETMRRVSALVPQDDLLTPSMTVVEALMEAALFKTGLHADARQAQVDTLIEQFGLGVCRDVIVGSPTGKKGISGGQKRRLSVALELCGSPSLLFLDEPTSGLDAVSTMTLVKLLASLAKGGMTVIATIHQPSAAAFLLPPRRSTWPRSQRRTTNRQTALHRGKHTSRCSRSRITSSASRTRAWRVSGARWRRWATLATRSTER